MEVALMVVVAFAVVVLPFALLVAFHGRDGLDSRGRRVDTRWRVRQRGT